MENSQKYQFWQVFSSETGAAHNGKQFYYLQIYGFLTSSWLWDDRIWPHQVMPECLWNAGKEMAFYWVLNERKAQNLTKLKTSILKNAAVTQTACNLTKKNGHDKFLHIQVLNSTWPEILVIRACHTLQCRGPYVISTWICGFEGNRKCNAR